jgi:hypothetical protein
MCSKKIFIELGFFFPRDVVLNAITAANSSVMHSGFSGCLDAFAVNLDIRECDKYVEVQNLYEMSA